MDNIISASNLILLFEDLTVFLQQQKSRTCKNHEIFHQSVLAMLDFMACVDSWYNLYPVTNRMLHTKCVSVERSVQHQEEKLSTYVLFRCSLIPPMPGKRPTSQEITGSLRRGSRCNPKHNAGTAFHGWQLCCQEASRCAMGLSCLFL